MTTTEIDYAAPHTAYPVGAQVRLLRPVPGVGKGRDVEILAIDARPGLPVRYKVAQPTSKHLWGWVNLNEIEELIALPDPPAAADDAPPALTVAYLPLAEVFPDTDNERGDAGADLEELTASIRARGVLEPLRVYALGGGGYRLSSGHRRRLAALAAGLTTVPAIIVSPPRTEADRAFDRLVTNLHRRDLGPLEEAAGYARLVAAGWTQGEIAAEIGRSQTHVSRRLGLLDQPAAIQGYLTAGTLTPAHIDELSRVTQPEYTYEGQERLTVEQVRVGLAKEAADEGMSQTALRARIKGWQDSQDSQRRDRERAAKAEANIKARQEREAAERAADPDQQAIHDQKQREEKKRIERSQQEERNRPQRKEIAPGVIRAALGQVAGEPPTAATWQAITAYLFYASATATQARLRPALEAASDWEALTPILAELIQDQFLFSLSYDGLKFEGYFGFRQWIDQQFQLNTRHTRALNAAGVGTGRAPVEEADAPALASDEEPPGDPPDDPEAVPTHCPTCGDALVQDDDTSEVYCPSCLAIYAYDTEIADDEAPV